MNRIFFCDHEDLTFYRCHSLLHCADGDIVYVADVFETMDQEELLQDKVEIREEHKVEVRESISIVGVPEEPTPTTVNRATEALAPEEPKVDASQPALKSATAVDSTLSKANELVAHDKETAEKLLKDLPEDEFLRFLEQSSPEQLQAFLSKLTPAEQPVSRVFQQLIGRLLSIPDEPRGVDSIIGWWESRRFIFNVVVGLSGIPTLLVLYFLGLASEGLIISGTIEYGILANICYTAGWGCELVARSWWKERARHLGPMLFSLGFAFSIFITFGAGILFVLLFLLLSIFR